MRSKASSKRNIIFVADITEMEVRLGGGGGSSRGGGGVSEGGSTFSSIPVLMGSVDGDLDGDGATGNLLALKSGNGLLLVLLRTNVDEAVALALPGVAPAAADDASRDNLEASLGEEGGEASVVNAEAKVGDKEHVLGGLSDGGLALRTRGPGSTRLADARGLLRGLGAFGSSLSSGSLAFSGGGGLLLTLDNS
jgi:hypothetical protein